MGIQSQDNHQRSRHGSKASKALLSLGTLVTVPRRPAHSVTSSLSQKAVKRALCALCPPACNRVTIAFLEGDHRKHPETEHIREPTIQAPFLPLVCNFSIIKFTSLKEYNSVALIYFHCCKRCPFSNTNHSYHPPKASPKDTWPVSKHPQSRPSMLQLD